jgi:hypothetical protein
MMRLEPIFQQNYNSHKTEIRRISNSPCSSIRNLAYNLTALKIDFCQELGIEQMKSVNALIFFRDEKVLLLEFKQSDPDRLPSIRINYFIQVFKNELPFKVAGSKELLSLICKKNGFVPKTTVINSIFLVNLNGQDYQSYMALTSPQRNISFVHNNHSFVLNCDSFDKYLKLQ